MYVVAARYYTKQGQDDEAARLLKEMIPISLAEPGCALYTVNRSVEDPRRFLLYEQYLDEAGFQAHTASAPFKERVLSQIVPLLESRERDIFETVDPS